MILTLGALQTGPLIVGNPHMNPLGLAILQSPKGPCSHVVDTWASKGFLYPCFVVYVGTTKVLEPFGKNVGPYSEPL